MLIPQLIDILYKKSIVKHKKTSITIHFKLCKKKSSLQSETRNRQD